MSLRIHYDTVTQTVPTRTDTPNDGLQPYSKRLFDMTFGCALLVATLPLQILIAILVKLDTRGPALFRQERLGQFGEIITVTKFRTMHCSMQDANGVRQALRNDYRVTRVGRFLRKSCLDELPQLWDVIRGRMSLVGPRPHPARMTIDGRPISDVLAGYQGRLRMRPGMTGLAQIHGNRGAIHDIAFGQTRVDLDNQYISNWSFREDVRILLMTLPVVLRCDNY